METNVTKYFQEALRYFLKKKGYGAQTWLAHKTGIGQQYISRIASKKRKGSEEVRRKIAKAAGYKYEEFLDLGRRLSEGKGAEEPPTHAAEPFPDYDKIMSLPLFERAYAIIKKAAEVNKLIGYAEALGDRRTFKKLPPRVADFMDGKITEPQLYEHYVIYFKEKVAWIDEELAKEENES